MLKTIIELIKNLFTWLIIVTPWERAVRVRGGKNMREMGPGCHLRIPFWDRYYKQSVRRRSVIVPPVTITTMDKTTMTIAGFLWYEISDIMSLYNKLHDAQDTIESEVSGAVAKYVSENKSESCGCDAIRESVEGSINLEKYGLTGVEFRVSTHAEHKTYRFLTGGAYAWSGGDRLNTTEVEG